MKRILNSIWFLALIVAVPAIILSPDVFDKYKAELQYTLDKANTDGITYFEDLNSDGEIERVEAFNNSDGIFALHCFTPKNKLIDQYNFPHFFHQRLIHVFFSDVDKDSLMEVYGFTVRENAVYLSWVEPLAEDKSFKSVFVDVVDTTHRKKLDVSVGEIGFFDFDGDSITELVFSLQIGYNWFPRKLFIYHPDEDRLESTPEMGVHFSDYKPFDLHGDGKMELLATSSSALNLEGKGVEVPYIDDRPRLFVFNSKLEKVVPPIEFPPGIASRVWTVFSDSINGKLVACNNNYSTKHPGTVLVKVDLIHSEISDEKYFPNIGKYTTFKKYSENKILAMGSLGRSYIIDYNLNVLDSIDLGFKNEHFLHGIYNRVKEDKYSESYLWDYEKKKLLIYLDNFKEKVELDFSYAGKLFFYPRSPGSEGFIVDTGSRLLHYYTIKKNSLHLFKYPVYLIFYLASVLFIRILQSARMRQIKEKNELRDRVHELQLMTLKNQLDPHFINNTFNTVASVIKQGRTDEAYDLFVVLSKMIRNNLQSSNEIYTTLKEELEFVKDYLEIQKFRFPEMFDYAIELDKTIKKDLEIPKMLIQIHVENALKHGLRHKKEKGMLVVRILKSEHRIKIEIEDSGIGRKKSQEINKGSNGIGLKTIKQIIDLNNKKRRNKITQQIVDLYNIDKIPLGTKVKITIKAD